MEYRYLAAWNTPPKALRSRTAGKSQGGVKAAVRARGLNIVRVHAFRFKCGRGRQLGRHRLSCCDKVSERSEATASLQ